MTDVDGSVESHRLKVADRCDYCHAAAYGIAEKDGKDLLFCGHHLAKFEDQLILQGFKIWDERYRLEVKLYADEPVQA